MSDAEAIDTGAEVTLPGDAEVSREDLIKIIEAGNAADSESADGAGGDAGDAADAPAQPPSAPSEPAVDPKVAARILAATKAEHRAKAERDATAKERAELDKQRAELTEQAKLVDQLKAAKLSPSKALELLGMSPKEFLESLATEHEPEAIAKRVAASTQSETEKLAAEVAKLRAEREEERRAIAQQQLQQSSYQAQEAFLAHVVDKAADYPHLTEEFTPREIAERGWRVATEHAAAYKKKFGEFPDDSVIADFLEGEAKARADERAAWRERIGKTAPTASQANATPQGQPAKANTPRTLTNGASSQKATGAKPWSQKDADEESKRLIQQLHQGD